MTRAISLIVNGQPRHVSVEARTTLVDALREQLRLTGTHVGCEHGVCGACTVLVDGDITAPSTRRAIRSNESSTASCVSGNRTEGLCPMSRLRQRCPTIPSRRSEH